MAPLYQGWNDDGSFFNALPRKPSTSPPIELAESRSVGPGLRKAEVGPRQPGYESEELVNPFIGPLPRGIFEIPFCD